MDAERWARVQQLFERAVELPEAARATFLEEACGADEELRREVRALLAGDEATHPLLDAPLERLAERMVGEDPAAWVGRRCGAYRLTGVVGEGGMGTVFLAEHADLGSRVAIKVLRDAGLSPARLERFLGEQRTLARLDHPSIARIHDADTLADGTPWFAMELVEGLPLTDYCAARATSLEGRLLLLRTVAEAVQHAHRHLVVHRDLKPSNILVRDDGTVKLLDFGIAKQLEEGQDAAAITRTGLRLMTPAYAAPEQVLGKGAGIHTDVYALGVILYELLAGRLPYEVTGVTPAEVERRITAGPALRPSEAAGRPPLRLGRGRASWSDLDVLCLTAMHADPARRYRTVDAFIREIDHLLTGEPLEARPDTLRYRAGKFVRRNVRGVAAAALAVLLLASMGAFHTVRLSRARDAAVAEANRTQRVQAFLFSLFQGGDEVAGPADSLRVMTLLERGLQEARALEGEPELLAELDATLGGIFRGLGQLDRADSLLAAAHERRRALFGPDHPLVAEAELALADLRVDQAVLPAADSLARAGLDRLRRALPAGDERIAAGLVVRGRVLEARGVYDTAAAVLEEAVHAYERQVQGPDSRLSAALTALGNTLFYAGDLEAADSVFRRVLALDRRLHGEAHPTVADALINVGAVVHELGRYEEAGGYYADALAISRAYFGDVHPKTASNLTMVGRNLVFQQRLDEAEEVLREAARVQEAIYGPDHPVVASTVNELGTAALLNGRLKEADAAYRRVEAIYRRVYPDGHWLVGIAASNRGSLAMQRELWEEALPLFREAVASFAEHQGPEAVNTGIARIKLGRVLLRLGRPGQAVAETRGGYDVLAPQMEPGVSWLQAARQDLTEAYGALGRSAEAERFRTERARYAGEGGG